MAVYFLVRILDTNYLDFQPPSICGSKILFLRQIRFDHNYLAIRTNDSKYVQYTGDSIFDMRACFDYAYLISRSLASRENNRKLEAS